MCIRDSHPIINQGGTLVNCVPDYVQVESYVRASNIEAIVNGNHRVNRALKAGGDAVGATCVIKDLPGYLPMRNDAQMCIRDSYREGSTITESQVRIAAKLVANGKADAVHNMFEDTLSVNMRGKNITPKTEGQKYYVDSIRKNTITFGIGPAGTGKTFLAVALAAFYLKNRNVDKIILTRPAVEAGERLGFLPGELQDKVDPYLRPLYDALHEMFGIEQVQRFMERGTIEVAPLAYMRGRTLENAFVILDEAQNTTAEQMKMFLTRLGNNSKMVVNGDKTQIDLPPRVVSGLGEAEKVLRHVSGINMVY